MRIALLADAYPPMRTSGAVQLRDLSVELSRQGHEITVLVAAPDQEESWQIEIVGGVRVVRLRSPKTKDIGYVRRTINEFLMPFAMLRNLRKSPVVLDKWDGVVWYSPTIFLGPLARALKLSSGCQGYLILRDIFPEWAADMGLMGRGLPYRIFKTIANHQYSVADVIGVQSPGNLEHFRGLSVSQGRRVEVLQNWLTDAPDRGCSIKVPDTSLAGRKIFVYAGNMGVAQGMDILLDLAEHLKYRTDIGFLFVGRGSDVQRLRNEASIRGLNNVLFSDEIDPDEIPGLYAQCHIGLVALDHRHKTHNIPGKFLSYMQAGLPVLASVNADTDLVGLIETENVGRVCTDASAQTLMALAEAFVDSLSHDTDYSSRCKALSARLFSPEAAVKQIIEALRGLTVQKESRLPREPVIKQNCTFD